MNDINLKPNSERTPSERSELARKAGVASGRKRRQRKTIAEGLRVILNEKTPDKAMTKQEAILIKAVTKLFADPDIRDIKTLAEILGELKTNITTDGFSLNILSSEAGKGNIEKIMGGD